MIAARLVTASPSLFTLPTGPDLFGADLCGAGLFGAGLALGAARSESLWRETTPWLIGLVVVAVIGCVLLMLLRRMLQSEVTRDAPFTLDALRELHGSGQLTDAEFEQAKTKMLQGAKAMAARERARRAEAEAARRRPVEDSSATGNRAPQRPEPDDIR